MKTKIPLLACIVTACWFTPAIAPAQAPTGNIVTNITNPTNAIWDITQASPLKQISFDIEEVEFAFDVDFVQSGGGKLAGAGNTVVTLFDGEQTQFAATYVVKGAITSVQGVGRLSFSDSATGVAFLEGANRKVSVSEKLNLVIDPVSRQIVSGTISRKASAAGLGSISDTEILASEPLPDELGDGSWTLSMNLQPDSNNKYSGTNNNATLTLATGMVYHFAIVGNYAVPTQQSKLVLKGVDAAKGSSLKVTLQGNEVTSILGKVSGHAISVK